MTKDLTSGNTFKLILTYAFPVWLGFLFQQFYTVVDTIIVGQFLGVDAVAAVGSTGSVCFLLVGFCMGLCGGFAVPVAQRFGAKEFGKMRKYIYNTIILCIFFSIVMTIFTVLSCKQILIWMLTPENIIDMAIKYVKILFWGIPFTILYNISSGILRALGDSKTPLFFLIMAAVLNIFLDLLFITSFSMGVTGAALATIISQGLSGLACVIYMVKHFPIIRIAKEEREFDLLYCKTLCLNGIPMGLQYSITAIGSVILQSSVNLLGSAAVAAVTTGSKISMFFCTTFDSMGTTMANFAGQNVGCGKYDRVKKGFWDCTIISACYAVVAFLIIYFMGANLSAFIVGSANTEVIKNAHLFMIINSLFYIPLAWINILRFGIQGMGHGPLAVFAGVFEMIARALVAIVFVPIYGFNAVCFASPVAWVLADLFLFPAFYYCIKKFTRT